MDERERNRQGLKNFFDALQSVLIIIQNLQQINTDREAQLEEIQDRLKDAQATLQLIAPHVVGPEHRDAIEGLITSLNTVLSCITEHLKDEGDRASSRTGFFCQTVDSRRVERPPIIVEEEQITYLRGLHFSWGRIAHLLGISESTLRRRRAEIQDEDHVSHWTDITGT